jgi:hypothetical protein
MQLPSPRLHSDANPPGCAHALVDAGALDLVSIYCMDNNRVGQPNSPFAAPIFVGTMEGMEKKRGRPRKQNGAIRAELLEVRLQPAEKQAFKEAADLAGLPLSAWVRERLRLSARQELECLGRSIPFLP